MLLKYAILICKWLRNKLLELYKFSFGPLLVFYYQRQLNKLPDDTQIILLSRQDFGTFIYHVYYARCWEEQRGKTALVLLTTKLPLAKDLAQAISPKTKLIYFDHPLIRACIWLFREGAYRRVIYSHLFNQLLLSHRGALYLFDAAPRSEFHTHFDWRLNLDEKVSSSLANAYRKTRKALDNCEKTMRDAFILHKRCGLARRNFETTAMHQLSNQFGIHTDFVVLNMNSKTYLTHAECSRSIANPKNYDILIDELIARGFDVVLQGRLEQPMFDPRKGLIDYAHSPVTSIKNDLALYSHCYFAITNKTGPESFCTVCNTPQLGLNYSEICQIIHNIKLRFWPKQYFSTTMGRTLMWQEMINAPSFYDLGWLKHDPTMNYYDMTEEELLLAVREFLPLVSQKDELWLEYTQEQQQFRTVLHPMHLDLYDYPAVPCQEFLVRYQ